MSYHLSIHFPSISYKPRRPDLVQIWSHLNSYQAPQCAVDLSTLGVGSVLSACNVLVFSSQTPTQPLMLSLNVTHEKIFPEFSCLVA